jgi:hypothetical protein
MVNDGWDWLKVGFRLGQEKGYNDGHQQGKENGLVQGAVVGGIAGVGLGATIKTLVDVFKDTPLDKENKFRRKIAIMEEKRKRFKQEGKKEEASSMKQMIIYVKDQHKHR